MQVKLASASSNGLRWRIGLVLVIIGTWALGLNYARITPLGPGHEIANASEKAHLQYVQTLIDGKGLPLPNVSNPQDQSFQPPLYYVVTTAYSKLIGLRGTTDDQALDIKLRSIGILFGVLTIFAVFRIAFQQSEDLVMSVLAAGMVGLSPMFCSIAGSITNETAGAFFATAALLHLTRPTPTPKNAIFAGIYTGLAFDTHPLAVVLVVPWLLAVWKAGENRKWFALGFAVAVGLAVPEILRNLRTFGTPIALGPAGGAPFDLAQFVNQTLKTGIGVFGSKSIYLSNFFYAPFLLFTGGAIIVGALSMRTAPLKNPLWFVLLGLAALAIYGMMNLHYFDPQAPSLLIAAGAWGILGAVGWRKAFPNDSLFQVFVLVLLLALVGLNMYVFHLLPSRFADVS